jgi:RNA polymerase sigma-70 factor, ECF subfamily
MGSGTMAEFALDYEQLSDIELASFVVQRDPNAVRVITRRNNQRLYRAARSVLRDPAEAEDAVQDAYLKAFAAMASFAGASSLSTWLTRIVINEALEHRRKPEKRQRILREQSVIDIDDHRERLMAGSGTSQSPEGEAMRKQIAKLLERAVANLPEALRPVFVLREIEGMSVEETAEALQIPTGTVKTRLFRSRRRLQRELDPEIRGALRDTFPFAGADCDALTDRVLAKYLGIELDKEPAIVVCKLGPAAQLTPQNDQLMSECHVLCFKPALRLEWRGQDGQDDMGRRRELIPNSDSYMLFL